jgi:WD40 repeat protein/S1-C subfamily serine protease
VDNNRELKARSKASLATAEVRRNSKRLGTAVLVDGRHLLTASHVLSAAQGQYAKDHTVLFPNSGIECSVDVVALGPEASDDIAVLQISSTDPASLPAALDICSDDRVPDSVATFGFPHAERRSEGVWREFTVSGQTSSGMRQLRWDEEVGTFVGQSGGPVVDTQSEQLVGILLAGSKDGRFDRFLPITEIARSWPGLPRRWSYAGEGAEPHFLRRAMGQISRAQGGDLFRGRSTALDAIKTFLGRDAPQRPLVVVGQPGSGKSAVLGRGALMAQEASGRGLVFHARGATLADFLEAIARFIGLITPLSIDHLLAELGAKRSNGEFTIFVDALDEAQSSFDAYSIADAISELSRLTGIYAVVGTRPLAVGNRFGPGSILTRLMVYEESQDNLVDLDVAPYRDLQAIVSFVDAMLSQEGAKNPGPAGCAWESYRTMTDVRRRLSKIIAERAAPNFLVAAMTSLALANRDHPLNPLDSSFDTASIPSDLGEALDKYFQSIDTASRDRVIQLLTALAYSRGSGVTDSRWVDFCKVLGYTATQADIDSFRNSPGADYLLQVEAEEADHTVRVFHRALVEQLLSRRPRKSEELKIYKSLLEAVQKEGSWERADPYIVTHLAEHALASGHVNNLLEQSDYIGIANISTLLSVLGSLDQTTLSEVGVLVLREGLRLKNLSAAERIWLLAVSATHASWTAVRDRLLGEKKFALLPKWAHPLGVAHQKFTGPVGPVHSVASGGLNRYDVIAAGGKDGKVYVWDRRGTLLFDPMEGHHGSVTSLAIGALDGEDVVISGGSDCTVRIWDQGGRAIGKPLARHSKPVTSVQLIKFAGEDAVLSIAARGEIIVWNGDGRVLRRFPLEAGTVASAQVRDQPTIIAAGYYNLSRYSPENGYIESAPVSKGLKSSITIGRLGHADVVACGLEDGSIAVWRLDGSPARQPLWGHEKPSRSVAIGRLGRRDVIVSVSQDNALVIWDDRGKVLHEPWAGHGGTSNVVALGQVKNYDVVICAGSDGIVRIWTDRLLLDRVRTNNHERVIALGAGLTENSLRIVTASEAGIEFWDQNGKAIPSNNDSVLLSGSRSLGIAESPYKGLMVTGTRYGEMSIFDTNANLIAGPIAAHKKRITAIATQSDKGAPCIATASLDKTVRIWDAEGNLLQSLDVPGRRGAQAISFGRISNKDVLVLAGSDGYVRIWDLHDKDWSFQAPPLPSKFITCLAVFTIENLDVIAVGCVDGRIRTWQVGQEDYRVSHVGHVGGINHLACIKAGASFSLISSGIDGVLRVWYDMRTTDAFPLSEPATHMVVVGSEIIISSGPALSVLDFEYDEERQKRCQQNINDAFESTYSTDSAHEFYPESVIRRVIGKARGLLGEGLPQEAIELLLPLKNIVPAICLAADAAFASGEESLIGAVHPYLTTPEMELDELVQAKLFGLAMTSDDLVSAQSASSLLGPSLHPGIIGLITLLDRDSHREWMVYRRTSVALRAGAFGSKFAFAHLVPEIAAMRILAVSRRQSNGDPDRFQESFDTLLADYWSWFPDNSMADRLLSILRRYVENEEPELLPYQLLSVYHVCHATSPVEPDFTDELVEILTMRLRLLTPKIRDNFTSWIRYSDLAASVVRRLY